MKAKISIHSKRYSAVQGLKYEVAAAKKELLSTAKSLRTFHLFNLLPRMKPSLTLDSKTGVLTVILTLDSGRIAKPKRDKFQTDADFMTAMRDVTAYKMNQIGGYVTQTLGYERKMTNRKLNYAKTVGSIVVGIIGAKSSIHLYMIQEVPLSTVMDNTEIQKAISEKLLKLLAI